MPLNSSNDSERPKNGNNKKHPFIKFKRRARYHYLKILRIDDPPERIARGAAIGVLMGVLPTFGLGAFMAIGVAFVLRANKAAAVLGSFIVNPLTAPFFWTLSIVIGSLILGEDYSSILAKVKDEGFFAGAEWTYLVYMVGNIILSILFTLASYYLVKWAIIRHRAKKELKRSGQTEY